MDITDQQWHALLLIIIIIIIIIIYFARQYMHCNYNNVISHSQRVGQ